MTAFEAELDRIVSQFVAQLADLARLAAYEMVVEALERQHGERAVARRSTSAKASDPSGAMRSGLRRTVDDFQRECIGPALIKHDGNITRAAKALRIGRVSLQRKMRRLRMRADDHRTT